MEFKDSVYIKGLTYREIELVEEYAKHLKSSRGCQCGGRRIEIVKEADESFHERTGCTSCNKWDHLPRIKR